MVDTQINEHHDVVIAPVLKNQTAQIEENSLQISESTDLIANNSLQIEKSSDLIEFNSWRIDKTNDQVAIQKDLLLNSFKQLIKHAETAILVLEPEVVIPTPDPEPEEVVEELVETIPEVEEEPVE
jgi:hypothetical protein